jgi:hypothetical protein
LGCLGCVSHRKDCSEETLPTITLAFPRAIMGHLAIGRDFLRSSS